MLKAVTCLMVLSLSTFAFAKGNTAIGDNHGTPVGSDPADLSQYSDLSGTRDDDRSGDNYGVSGTSTPAELAPFVNVGGGRVDNRFSDNYGMPGGAELDSAQCYAQSRSGVIFAAEKMSTASAACTKHSRAKCQAIGCD